MGAESFAMTLLAELRKLDGRARELCVRAGGKKAYLGLEDEGEWVAVVKLTGASKNFNVMSVLAPRGEGWWPTLKRGTPKLLAEVLAGELHYLWTIPVAAKGFNANKTDPESA